MFKTAKLLLGFLMFTQAIFLASTFGTWLVVVSVGTLATASLLLRLRKKPTDPLQPDASQPKLPRALIWIGWTLGILLIFAVTTLWRWSAQLGSVINPIYVGTDVLAHTFFFCSLLVWVMRPHQAHASMLPLGLLAVLLCVAAGGTSQSIAAQTTIGLAICVGYTLATQVILGAKRGTGGLIFSTEESKSSSTRWMGPILSLLTLSILLMGTSVVASGTNFVILDIRERLHEQLRSTLDAVNDESYLGGTGYVRGSKLGEIRNHLLADPAGKALGVRSEFMPGYMRGSAFDVYYRRKWIDSSDYISAERVSQDLNVSSTGEGRAELFYQLRKPLMHFPVAKQVRERTIPLEVYNDQSKGPVFFMPLNTRWIEARSGGLAMTQNHTIRMGIDTRAPYVVGATTTPIKTKLSKARSEQMLSVPGHLRQETERVAAQVCNDRGTARDKAKALEEYFQREFSYSLELPERPRGKDPIAHFLQTKHAAHCEYFASATTLVLRSAGVRTRYVTGYVVEELDDESDVDNLWMARNSSAHAWVEAYDPDSEVWFPVEPTPGRVYRTVDPNSGQQVASSLFDVFNLDDQDEEQGLIGRAVGWLLSFRATDPLMVLFRIAQLPLFCFLLFVLWTKYLKPSRADIDPIDSKSHRMLRKADRRLRRHGLVRRPSETIHQFADRIESLQKEMPEKVSLTGSAKWYRQYADARYQGQLPVEFSV